MLCCLYSAHEKVFFFRVILVISIVCLFHYVLTAINIHLLFILFIFSCFVKGLLYVLCWWYQKLLLALLCFCTVLGVFSVVLCLLYIWCWWYKQLLWRVCYILWSILLQEFYRFVPNDRPKLQIFPQKGIKVEVGSLHVYTVFGTKNVQFFTFSCWLFAFSKIS